MQTATEKSLAFQPGNMVLLKPYARAVNNIMSPTGIGLIISTKSVFSLDLLVMRVLVAKNTIVTVYCEDVIPI